MEREYLFFYRIVNPVTLETKQVKTQFCASNCVEAVNKLNVPIDLIDYFIPLSNKRSLHGIIAKYHVHRLAFGGGLKFSVSLNDYVNSIEEI